jgi:hypothetical protein
MEESNGSTPPPEEDKAARFVFLMEHDASVLELVRAQAPHTAPHGSVEKAWQTIADKFNTHFSVLVSWKVVRNRATRLMKAYEADELHSLRKSGKVELFPIVKTTLEDIKTQVQDHRDEQAAIKKENRTSSCRMGNVYVTKQRHDSRNALNNLRMILLRKERRSDDSCSHQSPCGNPDKLPRIKSLSCDAKN